MLFSLVVIRAADGIAVGLDDIAVASDSGKEDLDENGEMEWEEVNRDDADVVFMQHTGEIISPSSVSTFSVPGPSSPDFGCEWWGG